MGTCIFTYLPVASRKIFTTFTGRLQQCSYRNNRLCFTCNETMTRESVRQLSLECCTYVPVTSLLRMSLISNFSSHCRQNYVFSDLYIFTHYPYSSYHGLPSIPIRVSGVSLYVLVRTVMKGLLMLWVSPVLGWLSRDSRCWDETLTMIT